MEIQNILHQLGLGKYTNAAGLLTDDPAFVALEKIAGQQSDWTNQQKAPIADDPFDYAMERPQGPFHIEVAIDEAAEPASILVIPCEDLFICVAANEHICTLIKGCNNADCWEQQDGNLDDEITEQIGIAVDAYLTTL